MEKRKWVTANEYLERYEKYSRDIKRAMEYKKSTPPEISEEEADKAVAELKSKRRKIITEIDKTGKTKRIYSKILYKKYIEGKQMKEIAGELDRSYDYVRHKYGEAMRELEKRINEE